MPTFDLCLPNDCSRLTRKVFSLDILIAQVTPLRGGFGRQPKHMLPGKDQSGKNLLGYVYNLICLSISYYLVELAHHGDGEPVLAR